MENKMNTSDIQKLDKTEAFYRTGLTLYFCVSFYRNSQGSLIKYDIEEASGYPYPTKQKLKLILKSTKVTKKDFIENRDLIASLMN